MTVTLSSSALEVFVEPSGDSAQDHRNLSLVRQGLRKVFSVHSFFMEEEKIFSPKAKFISFSDPPGCLILLVSPFYLGVEKFFYEMISRWLFPGRQLAARFFSYCTFFFSSDRTRRFSFCEMHFSCQDSEEVEQFLRQFSQIEADLHLGAQSFYQGSRILELRGHSSLNKKLLIQEKIGALIQRRPKDFDYDLFGQMQHFLVTCKEDFKQLREISHLHRIICVFYLFRKSLRQNWEKEGEKRYISFKVSPVRLHSPFGVRKVLGVFVGFTIVKKHEIFEERHLLQAICEYIPSVKFVEGSKFSYHQKEERVQILYLEIEKESKEGFSVEEIQNLRKNLPFALEPQVESLVPKVFMPRNEEEVMKNIVMLSNQLRYIKDIPQVLISFEEQTDHALSFTVVLLRLLLQEKEPSIRQLFLTCASELEFVEDRVKLVGLIRGKYKKEACVFRLKVPKSL